MKILGIDIGGSGIKGAVVDCENGELLSERLRVPTPQPATPAAVAEAVRALLGLFAWNGVVGIGFPAIVSAGVARSAANISPDWIGVNVAELMTATTGCDCFVLNDADAAGLAEMEFGAGRGREDAVLVLTLGTGIGSALFYQQRHFPNLELGALSLKGGLAEQYAAAVIRKQAKLSWKAWSKRLNLFLAHVERLLCPDLIVVGGGVSRRSEKFFPYLTTRAELMPARLLNQAGIIGAACYAAARCQPLEP